MSNIRRVHDPKKNDDKKKDDRKVEEFSVGGAQSTTAVLRPIRDRDEGNPLEDLVLNAKKTTLQEDSEDIPDSNVAITVYKNGFIVGDEPFRDAAIPSNRLILDQLLKGEVPQQLEGLMKGTDAYTSDKVKLNLINKSSETFTPPPEGFSFEKSQGFSLQDQPSQHNVSLSQLPPVEFILDSSQPTANIMLQLANGQRVRMSVNMSTTVAQIYQHVRHLSQTDDNTTFRLNGGFPVKELNNGDSTVELEKLKGCSIVQKML